MNKDDLCQFLIDSNKAGYAGGEEKKWIKELDSSTTIPYAKGLWKSHDNFFGGEPYGGRTVVFYDNKPVWMMVYYGFVVEGVETDQIYSVLKEALKRMPEQSPFRGPKEYIQNDFTYTNLWDGDVERFSGVEKIIREGKLVYKANYIGGLVDRRQ